MSRLVVERPECQHVLFPATRVDPEERCAADDVAVGQEFCTDHGGLPADDECRECELPLIRAEAPHRGDPYWDPHSYWCSDQCLEIVADRYQEQEQSA